MNDVVLWLLLSLRLAIAVYMVAAAVHGYLVARRDLAAMRQPLALPVNGNALSLAFEGVRNERDRAVAYSIFVWLAVNSMYGNLHGFNVTFNTYLAHCLFVVLEVLLTVISYRSRDTRRRIVEGG